MHSVHTDVKIDFGRLTHSMQRYDDDPMAQRHKCQADDPCPKLSFFGLGMTGTFRKFGARATSTTPLWKPERQDHCSGRLREHPASG